MGNDDEVTVTVKRPRRSSRRKTSSSKYYAAFAIFMLLCGGFTYVFIWEGGGDLPWPPNNDDNNHNGPPPPPSEFAEVFSPPGESNVRCGIRLSDDVGLIGTEESGDVYKTTDGGLTWRKIVDLASQGVSDVRWFCLAADGSVLMTTTRSGKSWIMKSTDQGETWRKVYETSGARTFDMVLLDNNDLLCGGRGDSPIYKSRDNGETWSLIAHVDSEKEDAEALIDLGGGVVLCGVGWLTPPARIYKSTDYGETWRLVFTDQAGTHPMAFVKTGGVVVCGVRNTGKMYRSTDKGETWQQVAKVSSPAIMPRVALNHKGVTKIFACVGSANDIPPGYIAVWVSTDLGLTWKEYEVVDRPSSYVAGTGTLFVINKATNTLILGSGNHYAHAKVWRSVLG